MWQTIRYRRLQAVAILLLAALVTTCAAFTTLYVRAAQQALTRIALDQAPLALSSLRVSAGGADTTSSSVPQPEEVASVVPPGLRRLLARPLYQWSAQPHATAAATGSSTLVGTVLTRVGQCGHLSFVRGRCPNEDGQIAVSTADARTFGLSPGAVVQVDASAPGRRGTTPTPFTVSGVYRQRPGPFWFDARLTGLSGMVTGFGSTRTVQHDVWVAGPPTFTAPGANGLADARTEADFAADPARTGVDDLLRAGPAVTRVDGALSNDPGYVNDGYQLSSGLPGIAADVRHQREQSRVTVPLLMAQLGLLAVVVLWLVLGAVTEQRRPEIAVAVLRGRGRAGARRLLLRELVPLTLLGVPVGFVAALALSWMARTWLLPGSAPFELRWSTVPATGGAAVVLLLVTSVAVLGVTRHRVETLLRRVAERRSTWALGVLEALLLAAAGTATLAFVTGSLTGPIAQVAPALLALVVGMLLAHATTPSAALLGRRLLRRGRVAGGISVLDVARTPAVRRTIAIVTVAASLLVFVTAAVLVGSRNRGLAAEQRAGAAMTADVYGDRLDAVQAAVRSVDPHERHLTPVVTAFPPGGGGQETLAVDPVAFSRIARFAGRSTAPDLSAAASPKVSPILLQGDTVRLELSTPGFRTSAASLHGTPVPPELSLQLLTSDNEPITVSLGDLPDTTSSREMTTPVSCTSGCHLVGISVQNSPGATTRGSVTLAAMATSTGTGPAGAVALGPASRWTPLTGRSSMRPTSRDPSSLTMAVVVDGSTLTTMRQVWLPLTVPAIVTEGEPATVTGLDGEDRDVRVAGRLRRLPQAAPRTALVDLDLMARGTQISPTDRIQVWFDRADPTLLSRLTQALGRRGVQLSGHTTLRQVRRGYDDSLAAWSLALGVVVGVSALLLGLIVVVVMAVTTWRSRSRDLAALRLAGVDRRTARSVASLAQVPALVVAVVAGAACGVVGARLTLPTLPLFPHRPRVSTLDLSLPWVAVVVVAGAALAALVVVGWCAGAAIARRADLERVRESV